MASGKNWGKTMQFSESIEMSTHKIKPIESEFIEH